MPKRKIITINEKKCNGCGECIPNCPESAIQIIDGKARLKSDIFCDGLGACLGHCSLGAISIEEREAEIYDEKKVMGKVVEQGKNTIHAHLQHLKNHGETTYLANALEYLQEHNIDVDFNQDKKETFQQEECTSAHTIDFTNEKDSHPNSLKKHSSKLQQWPVQMHLISPNALYFRQSDLLLSADCVAYTLNGFHHRFLSGKNLTIACPKLDANREVYLQKLISLIDDAKINTLTVITMEVPCCHGLFVLAKNAVAQASRKISLKHIMVSIKGEILKDVWL